MAFRKRAVVFGDSFVAAAIHGRPGFGRLLALLMGWRGQYLGLGGTGFVKVADDGRRPYASRLHELISLRSDVVIVQASGNDASVDSATVEAAAREFLTVVQASAPRVYVLGPMWTIANPENLPRLRDTVDLVCGELGIPFVDGLGWLNESVIGNDGEHPTWRGHSRIAWRLARAIRG